MVARPSRQFERSLTAQMVCAYLMATEGLSLEEAIVSVREKRRVICPNQGFYAQLQLWEQMGCKLDESNPTYRYSTCSCQELALLPEMKGHALRCTVISVGSFDMHESARVITACQSFIQKLQCTL